MGLIQEICIIAVVDSHVVVIYIIRIMMSQRDTRTICNKGITRVLHNVLSQVLQCWNNVMHIVSSCAIRFHVGMPDMHRYL